MKISPRTALVSLAATLAWGVCACCAPATEPNESFAAATVLGAGTLMVSDTLTPGDVASAPDTLLGIRGPLGNIVQIDDDGSLLGTGSASGVAGAATNSGSVQFAVTGFGDESFAGIHSEHGAYVVHIDVFSDAEELLESFQAKATMTPDVVDEFDFSDSAWVGGSYDVNIDNEIFQGGDVDFFRFTGLLPGAAYTAKTLDPAASGVDTVIGWFGPTGILQDFDDDGAGGLLSQLAVTATPSGTVTLAVAGFGDEEFLGEHSQSGGYQLKLTATAGFAAADFDENHAVNGLDLDKWKLGFSTSGSAVHGQGDANGDKNVDGADVLIWQRQQVTQIAAALVTGVPEPATGSLLVGGLLTALVRRGRNSSTTTST